MPKFNNNGTGAEELVVEDRQFVGEEDFRAVQRTIEPDEDVAYGIPEEINKTIKLALSPLTVSKIRSFIKTEEDIKNDPFNDNQLNEEGIDFSANSDDFFGIEREHKATVTFYDNKDGKRVPVNVTVTTRVPKNLIPAKDDENTEFVPGWFGLLFKAYTAFLQRNKKDAPLDVNATLNNFKFEEFYDAVSKDGIKNVDYLKTYSSTALNDMQKIMDAYKDKGGMHIYDERNEGDLLINAAFGDLKNRFKNSNLMIATVIEIGKKKRCRVTSNDYQGLCLHLNSGKVQLKCPNFENDNVKIISMELYGIDAGMNTERTIVDLTALKQMVFDKARELSDTRMYEAMVAFKSEGKAKKPGNRSNNEMMINWMEEGTFDEFSAMCERKNKGAAITLNRIIDYNVKKPGSTYKELAFVKACKLLDKEMDAVARKNILADELFAKLKLKYAQMVDENTIYETRKTIAEKEGTEFNSISESISSLRRLLDNGDSIFRGSSREYKNIKSSLDEAGNMVSRLTEKNAAYDKDAKEAFCKLISIKKNMDDYISKRENVEISETRDSYKGTRVKLMREARAKLQADMDFLCEKNGIFKNINNPENEAVINEIEPVLQK